MRSHRRRTSSGGYSSISRHKEIGWLPTVIQCLQKWYKRHVRNSCQARTLEENMKFVREISALILESRQDFHEVMLSYKTVLRSCLIISFKYLCSYHAWDKVSIWNSRNWGWDDRIQAKMGEPIQNLSRWAGLLELREKKMDFCWLKDSYDIEKCRHKFKLHGRGWTYCWRWWCLLCWSFVQKWK